MESLNSQKLLLVTYLLQQATPLNLPQEHHQRGRSIQTSEPIGVILIQISTPNYSSHLLLQILCKSLGKKQPGGTELPTSSKRTSAGLEWHMPSRRWRNEYVPISFGCQNTPGYDGLQDSSLLFYNPRPKPSRKVDPRTSLCPAVIPNTSPSSKTAHSLPNPSPTHAKNWSCLFPLFPELWIKVQHTFDLFLTLQKCYFKATSCLHIFNILDSGVIAYCSQQGFVDGTVFGFWFFFFFTQCHSWFHVYFIVNWMYKARVMTGALCVWGEWEHRNFFQMKIWKTHLPPFSGHPRASAAEILSSILWNSRLFSHCLPPLTLSKTVRLLSLS